MKFQILIAGLLAVETLAAPSNSLKKRTFSVQKRQPQYSSGYAALLKSYHKYGIDPNVLEKIAAAPVQKSPAKSTTSTTLKTTSTKIATAKSTTTKIVTKTVAQTTVTSVSSVLSSSSSTSSAPANTEIASVNAQPAQSDTEFLAPVNIGGQTLALDFDTGSADLWVWSTQQPASQRRGHTVFDPTKSKTFQNQQGSSWSIQYGDGSGASGTVGTDTVNIGGAVVQNQIVELATQVSASFQQDTNSDGLVGLGFSRLNTVKPNQAKTFFDNVMPSLELPVFTAALKHSGTGTYNFGFIDNSQFSGSLNYVPVNPANGFWQFSVAGFSANGKTIAGSGDAIADTGTTLILLTDAITSAYYATISSAKQDSAGTWNVNCNAAMPTLGIKTATGYTATVASNLMTFAANGDGTCMGSLQSSGSSGLMVLGDVFFKSQFVVFDGGKTQLGLAPNIS